MLQVESLEQNPTISTGDKTAKKETGCRVWGMGCGEIHQVYFHIDGDEKKAERGNSNIIQK